jgi:[pyruvate, water dikinase]-phosphate phosphotransferase / [pyruvate, water dikinase] kinase
MEHSVSQQKTIFIISDSTGETAYHVLQTVLAQFDSRDVRVRRYPDIVTPGQIRAIVEEAVQAGGLVFHTLISPGLRESATYLCSVRGIRCVDVLGLPVERLSLWLDQQPRYTTGLTRKLDDSYSRRTMALEFALRHDDGQNTSGLPQADLVLVGVSRTAKTPLSVYLAYHAWLVGNVPIVEAIDAPSILFDLPKEKVIALTVQPDRLAMLRGTRNRRLGIEGDYDDLRAVQSEVRHALMLYERAGWQVIDMTYKTIEEATDEILAGLKAGSPRA